jgi:PTS system fructose-specific IIC component
VFVFFAISNFLLWLLAIVIGMVVGALAVTIAKSFGHSDAEDAPEDAIDLEHAHTPATVSASASTA